MKDKKYTVAIVGCGRIGFSLGFDKKREQPASHTMAFKKNPSAKIIAGVDTNLENLKLWHKANPNAQIFSSVNDLFLNLNPDIVCVAVNEVSHLETALAVLKARPRLMILEKPVALNMSEGRKIKLAASKVDAEVLVNHERRYDSHYGIAYDYMKRIGKVQSITATLSSGMRLYDRREEKTGAYSLIHDGTHLVDIVMFLLESIEKNKNDTVLSKPSITGFYKDESDKNIVRNFSAHYKTKSCPDVTINMSGRCKYFGFDIDVRGTEGRICIGNGYAKFYSRQESKLYTGFYSLRKDKTVKVPKKTFYFSNMAQNALDFLDGKEKIKSNLETGLNALKVLEEIKSILVTMM